MLIADKGEGYFKFSLYATPCSLFLPVISIFILLTQSKPQNSFQKFWLNTLGLKSDSETEFYNPLCAMSQFYISNQQDV